MSQTKLSQRLGKVRLIACRHMALADEPRRSVVLYALNISDLSGAHSRLGTKSLQS